MAETTPERSDPARKKILIVDDHPVLRRGLAALIDSEPDLVVCAEAGSCPAGLDAGDCAVGDPGNSVVLSPVRIGVPGQVVRNLNVKERSLQDWALRQWRRCW